MRFLADESCDFTFVRVLRSAGHDVLAVAESAPGAFAVVEPGRIRIGRTPSDRYGEIAARASTGTSMSWT